MASGIKGAQRVHKLAAKGKKGDWEVTSRDNFEAKVKLKFSPRFTTWPSPCRTSAGWRLKKRRNIAEHVLDWARAALERGKKKNRVGTQWRLHCEGLSL